MHTKEVTFKNMHFLKKEKNKLNFFESILGIISSLSILFLLSPVLALFSFPWKKFIDLLADPSVLQALIITLKSTFISLIIIVAVGTPTAYYMARYSFLGKEIVEMILKLPLVLPPAVVGLLLLITFGRNGMLGKYLYLLKIQLPFTFAAIVMVQIFVGLPVFIQIVKEGFEKIHKDLEAAAAVCGCSRWNIFKNIALPLAKDTLLIGAVLSWARALAEFGATILFAGNLSGKTQTLPLLIYTALEKDLDLSMGIALFLLIISMGVIGILKYVTKRKNEG